MNAALSATSGTLPTGSGKVPTGSGATGTSQTSSSPGSWFSSIRDLARERAAALPMPQATDELWRYTRPELFDFDRLNTPAVGGIEIVSGLLPSGELPPGVLLSSGDTLSVEEQRFVTQQLSVEGERSALPLRQVACLGSVAVLRVRRNVSLTEPLVIRHHVRGDGTAFASLLVVVVEPGAEAAIVEEVGEGLTPFYLPRVELVVQANGSLTFVSHQRMGRDASMLALHRAGVEKDGRLRTVHVGTGGGVSRIDLDCRLLQPGASADLNGLFLVDGTRHADFHPTQDHLAPNCRSDLYCKVALKDRARSVYYGYIKVADGAQKTDAYQTNRNLLLSPEARADSIPNLEIRANDVKCSHGSSIGQMSQEELFYLRSRGLTVAQAELLLVEGFFTDLLARIPAGRIRDQVTDHVLHQLHVGTEVWNAK